MGQFLFSLAVGVFLFSQSAISGYSKESYDWEGVYHGWSEFEPLTEEDGLLEAYFRDSDPGVAEKWKSEDRTFYHTTEGFDGDCHFTPCNNHALLAQKLPEMVDRNDVYVVQGQIDSKSTAIPLMSFLDHDYYEIDMCEDHTANGGTAQISFQFFFPKDPAHTWYLAGEGHNILVASTPQHDDTFIPGVKHAMMGSVFHLGLLPSIGQLPIHGIIPFISPQRYVIFITRNGNAPEPHLAAGRCFDGGEVAFAHD